MSRPATLARSAFLALALCATQLASGCETAFSDLSRHGRTDLVELCCPEDSLISKTVEELGGTAQCFGLHNGCDLSRRKGRDVVGQYLYKHRPRHLWISVPCGPWSRLQQLNTRTPEQLKSLQDKHRAGRRMLRHAVDMAKLQLVLGGEVHWEHPRHAYSWQEPCVSALRSQLRDARLDGMLR